MKKIVKIFSILLAVFLLANCSENIYLHDGQDGKDGVNGFSTLMFFDNVAQMKIYYLERDNEAGYTNGDTILYRESEDGLKIIKNETCYDIIQVIGTTEFTVATICDGTKGDKGDKGDDGSDGQNGTDGTNGTNGENGEDAYNLVIGSVPYPDQYGNTLGQILSFYWDINKDGFLDSGDLLKFSLPVPSGTNGTNGGTSIISMEEVGDSLIFTTTVNEVVVSRKAILTPRGKDGTDGKDGEDGTDGQNGTDGTNGVNGQNPSLKTIVFPLIGVTYTWYIDVSPYNNNYDEGVDIKLSEEMFPYAKDGQTVDPFVSMTLSYDFQGASSSYFGGTGFNSRCFYYNDGNIYTEASGGYFSFPPFVDGQQYDLISLTFNYGSTDPYKILVKVIDMDNIEHVVDTINFKGTPSFNRVIYDTYSIYKYDCVALNSIEFKNVKRIKLEVVDCNPESKVLIKCTNADIFFDNFIMLYKKRF